MNPQAVIDQSSAPGAEATEQPTALTFQPNVDIRDVGGEVSLIADIPGANAAGIEVTFEDGVLTMHATVPPREQPGRPIRQEYGIGNYRRSFRLGEGFDASQITADYARGVLTVRVPRLAAVRPRKVEVRAG
ncbi:MAG: Hsp20/alpha crystallin family protein [Planctomycetia bacterium]|nr:Hsp20/alpha crystallin family protein [Planctomycetia bacterium]